MQLTALVHPMPHDTHAIAVSGELVVVIRSVHTYENSHAINDNPVGDRLMMEGTGGDIKSLLTKHN